VEDFVSQMLQFKNMAACCEFPFGAGIGNYLPTQCFVAES
jgi:hypothetical protein